MFSYHCRVTFKALDTESGVHRIGYSIVMHSPGKTAQLLYNSSEPANMKPVLMFFFLFIYLFISLFCLLCCYCIDLVNDL